MLGLTPQVLGYSALGHTLFIYKFGDASFQI